LCARRKRDAIIGVSVSDTIIRHDNRHRQHHREFAEQPPDDAAHQQERYQHRHQRHADRDDRNPISPAPLKAAVSGFSPSSM